MKDCSHPHAAMQSYGPRDKHAQVDASGRHLGTDSDAEKNEGKELMAYNRCVASAAFRGRPERGGGGWGCLGSGKHCCAKGGVLRALVPYDVRSAKGEWFKKGLDRDDDIEKAERAKGH